MVHTFTVRGGQIDLSMSEKPLPMNSVLPSIEFTFRFQNRDTNVILSNLRFKFHIKNARGATRFLKFMDFETPQISVGQNENELVPGYLLLDPYTLFKIEEIREGGDLNFFIRGALIGEKISGQNHIHMENCSNLQITDTISKSDWVEKFLPSFDYKHVSLVEIPHLSSETFSKIAGYLDSAWKQKHMGQYDNTLTDCRKAIEETRSLIQSEGFVKENSDKRDKTDWKTFFDSDSIGKICEKIDQQIYWFTSKGAHPGRGINLEDADFALLISQALINYVIKNSSK